MKYIPVTAKDRKFVGKHWNPRYLRGIQCILHATHGVVGAKRKFFEAAFGRNVEEFKKLILMPDKYIIYRDKHKSNGAADWSSLYASLSPEQKAEFQSLVYSNQFNNVILSKYRKVDTILTHYIKQ